MSDILRELVGELHGPNAEVAWEKILELNRRSGDNNLNHYGMPTEYMLRAARMPTPWKNGNSLSNLLLPRRVYSVQGSEWVHPAHDWSKDPETDLRNLLRYVDASRHSGLISELFESTFNYRAHCWPWTDLVEEIRHKALASKLRLLRELVLRLNEEFKEVKDKYISGKRKSPPMKSKLVSGWLNVLKPIFHYVSGKLEPLELRDFFSRELYDIHYDLREAIRAPYYKIWQKQEEEKRLQEEEERLEEQRLRIEPLLDANGRWNGKKLTLQEAKDHIKFVEFVTNSSRPYPLEVLQGLLVELEKAKTAIESEEAAERERIEVERQLYAEWQERIGIRCRSIVGVFNGVFNLDINPDSVLSGEVEGSYASIHSGGGMGLVLRQSMELRQEIHLWQEWGTWLELEEGGDEAEWVKAYDAENFLIWHELSHLADGPTLGRMLRAIPEYLTLAEDDRLQARELVIDAIALGLAEALYVHPDKRRHLVTPSTRQAVMLRALCVQTRRLTECGGHDDFGNILRRLYVQLDAHRSITEIVAPTLSDLASRLEYKMDAKSIQHRAYEVIYAKARRLDVLKLEFHPHVQSLDEGADSASEDVDSESFVGAN